MGQFSKVLLTIDNARTVPKRAQDCRPGLVGFNQVYGSNHPTPSVYSIYDKYIQYLCQYGFGFLHCDWLDVIPQARKSVCTYQCVLTQIIKEFLAHTTKAHNNK